MDFFAKLSYQCFEAFNLVKKIYFRFTYLPQYDYVHSNRTTLKSRTGKHQGNNNKCYNGMVVEEPEKKQERKVFQ